MPTEVEVLRMYMSKTEERMRRRDLRKIFVDPNAYGVALPAVGFDSENTTRGVFSAQDDTKGGRSSKQFDKSKFERHQAKEKQFSRPFWVVVPKWQRERLIGRAYR